MKKKTTKSSTRIVLFCLMIVTCINVQGQNKPEFQLRGLLEMFRKGDKTNAQRIATLNTLIPENIRGQVTYSLAANSAWYYTKIVSEYDAFNGDNYLELCKRVDSTGIKFIVNVGEKGNHELYPDPPSPLTPTTKTYHFTPSQVDSIFKYAPNCVGIESGENFWTYNSTTAGDLIDLLRVCKKYNKKYILGEGGWGYNSYTRFFSDYYSTLKSEGLGAYLQTTFKNTKPYGALVSQGSIFGSWLTGLTDNFGTWNDEFVWTYGSFRDANDFRAYIKAEENYKKVPFTHYLKSWLLTIAMGGKINFMETPTFTRKGVPDPNCAPYLFPFIKGLADHDMLPGKEAVLAKVKAIADPYEGTYALSNGTMAPYTGSNLVTYNYDFVNYKPAGGTNAEPFARLYNMTSGIWDNPAYTSTGVTDAYYKSASGSTGLMQLPNALIREQIPNNSRYLIIPLLPHPDAAAQIPSGLERIALSAYQTDAGLKTKFESLYPAVTPGNDAWAVEVDNRFFVINSHENADIDQNFAFDLSSGGIKTLTGVMPFQNLLFGKREGQGEYWFQSNGYAVRDGSTVGQQYICTVKPTTLNFNCESRPTVTVEDGKSASVQETWDADTNTLTLTITHDTGAVNFWVIFNRPGQTINFNSLPGDKIPGDVNFAPGATSTSGLPVTYTSSNPAVATIVDNQIHIVSNGTTQITAQQSGNPSFLPAPDVAQTLTIAPSRPYAANIIPGVIEAENYDIGIEGKAYHDTSAGNSGYQSFRPGADVDVNTCNDTGAGYKIQSIVGGEWMDYTIQVDQTSTYLVAIRCAYNTTGGKFRIAIDGLDVSGIIDVPNTSNWITWASVSKEIALTAGTHKMRLFFINGGYHINKLTFSYSGVPGSQLQRSAKQQLSLNPQEDYFNTGIVLYPNPFSGNEFSLKVSNKIASDIQVELFSVLGERVFRNQFADVKPGENILDIKLPFISNGVYLMNVKTVEGIKTFKVIKE